MAEEAVQGHYDQFGGGGHALKYTHRASGIRFGPGRPCTGGMDSRGIVRGAGRPSPGAAATICSDCAERNSQPCYFCPAYGSRAAQRP